MTLKLMSAMLVLGISISAHALEKGRFPASLDCSSKTTSTLQELVHQLALDGTIKQSRYEKMMNSFGSAADCEAVNDLMLSAIGDCTLKSLKKTQCK
jgi:hypothetical protein